MGHTGRVPIPDGRRSGDHENLGSNSKFHADLLDSSTNRRPGLRLAEAVTAPVVSLSLPAPCPCRDQRSLVPTPPRVSSETRDFLQQDTQPLRPGDHRDTIPRKRPLGKGRQDRRETSHQEQEGAPRPIEWRGTALQAGPQPSPYSRRDWKAG